MKISSLPPIAAASTYKSNRAVPQKPSVSSLGEDRIELSNNSGLFAQMLKEAKAQPAERSEKVSSIQGQIQNGSYTIDSAEIARKMMFG